MPTNKQRRDAARRHLERQLQQRQEREARRKKATLIISIVATIVLIAVVIGLVVGLSGSTDKTPAASSKTSPISSPSASTGLSPSPSSPSPSPSPSTSYPKATGASVSFAGVIVHGAKDLKGIPSVTTRTTKPATKLMVKDLVVGKGRLATPTSTVSVQYVGVLYNKGTVFDSSWQRGMPIQFPLTGVVKGFTYGIGGTKGVPPMHVGGRRVMILPSKLGYGPKTSGPIPGNSSLVFVVDLKSIK
ncbi:MAG: FKBP-type peptidyl-prolyl cis-trans isomerase [Actinomycetota bacterium]|nr:FKBP-type peptidyl-prolyl cis-trans isomerase [Actinomycetota bacterium]